MDSAYDPATGYSFTCANCRSQNIGQHHAVTSPDGKLHFCDDCGAIAEALNIGARRPVMLYDDGKGNATAWAGGALGQIVHKRIPLRHRFSAVRYGVRMLDGSLWHGSGPTDNGTYIRLKPMKGE